MSHKKFLFMVGILLLSGCGSDIDRVKDSRSPYDDLYKIGDIFDKRSSCKDIVWTEFKTDKNIDIVEYVCKVDVSKEIEIYEEKFIKKSKEAAERSYLDSIEKNNSSLAEYPVVIEERIKELNAIKEAYGDITLDYDPGPADRPSPMGLTQEQYKILKKYRKQESLKNDIVSYNYRLDKAKKFTPRPLEEIEKEYIDLVKSSITPPRNEYQLIAQFTFVDDEKKPRIYYLGSKSIFTNGSERESKVGEKTFFYEMHTDYIIEPNDYRYNNY
ncbi:hypothetical protein [Shewanella glacialipiscicola]|uniref:hypothetical protein n=1 Tax=Shewanella glacialipiscicola TaxID=614069 RepID=UPI003D79B764